MGLSSLPIAAPLLPRLPRETIPAQSLLTSGDWVRAADGGQMGALNTNSAPSHQGLCRCAGHRLGEPEVSSKPRP